MNLRTMTYKKETIILLVAHILAFSVNGLTTSTEENILWDASFEDTLPCWLETGKRQRLAIDKSQSDSAADGKIVLQVRGWTKDGAVVLSPVLDLRDVTYSATAQARSFGPEAGPEVEFALFDEVGRDKLLSFGTITPDGKGKWRLFVKEGAELTKPPNKGRFAIIPKGPQRGFMLEIDQIGLFPGAKVGTVTDNAETVVFEAEDVADGKAWRAKDHYRNWYTGMPSKMRMASGDHPLSKDADNSVSKTVRISQGGRYKLWVRFVTVNCPSNGGEFTVALEQNGKVLASKTIHDADTAYPKLQWVWDDVEADLEKGEVRVVLSRPRSRATGVARKIDMFVLTNNTSHKPKIEDFRPTGYMRFTNLSENQEPFCLWVWVRRHQKPWHSNPGILSMAGNSLSWYVPKDKDLWIKKGDVTPWINISDHLLQAGERNNVSLTATRGSHVSGFVSGVIKGILEFAVGRDHKIVKTIPINQDAPKILLTLPANFENKADEILTPTDYIRKKLDVTRKLPDRNAKRAEHLELTAILTMRDEINDSKELSTELEILRDLGFNSLYHLVAAPDKAETFNSAHGFKSPACLASHAWYRGSAKSLINPDMTVVESVLAKYAEENKPLLNRVDKMKLADEPGAPSYQKLIESEEYRNAFSEYAKSNGLTPKDLGVSTWKDVVPVGPEKSGEFPELFYQTALFRLNIIPQYTRKVTEIKNRLMPGGPRTYVNYVPNWSGSSIVQQGVDPFLAQRGGSLEQGWTEDWLGYGAGPQHVSTMLALLRSACRGQSFGCYVVGDTMNPELLRLKIYTAIAGGARTILIYNYGPAYTSIDSWSLKRNLYPEISKSLHELSAIDGALKDAKRMRSDIAILYNRTASIWEGKNSTTEQNGQYTHWGLAHAGYDADIVPEEDVLSGELANYKLLYADGVNMRREVAEKIVQWVEDGGILVGSTAVGTRDKHNRPMNILEPVFGITSTVAASKRDPASPIKQSAGRAKYEIRTLKAFDEFSTTAETDTPQTTIKQFCVEEKIHPGKTARPILIDARNAVGGVSNDYGKGKAIRLACLPGIAYLNSAVAGKDYDPNSYLPKNFAPSIRDFIAWPAKLAKAFRTAETKEPITEIVRYDAEKESVFFVLDNDAVGKDEITIRLFDAAHFSKVRTASGNPVELMRENDDTLTIKMPIHTAEALVLERAD